MLAGCFSNPTALQAYDPLEDFIRVFCADLMEHEARGPRTGLPSLWQLSSALPKLCGVYWHSGKAHRHALTNQTKAARNEARNDSQAEPMPVPVPDRVRKQDMTIQTPLPAVDLEKVIGKTKPTEGFNSGSETTIYIGKIPRTAPDAMMRNLFEVYSNIESAPFNI